MALLRLRSNTRSPSPAGKVRLKASHRPTLALRSSHRRTSADESVARPWVPPNKDRDLPFEPTPATGKRARKKAKRKKRGHR